MAENQVFTIGIAGGTGSGKSSIVDRIIEAFPGRTSLVRYDNYYKEHHDMPMEEREKLNYDCPEAFDTDLLIEHVKKLQNWESIDCPVYDFTAHDRSDETIRIEPNKILIVEGIFALTDQRLLDLMDTKIYVDVDADVRVLRRLRRDIAERGRTIDSVITQYLDTVKPMHEKYVAPSRANASIIIPQGAYNTVAINIIIGHIRHYTNEWDLDKEFGFEELA